MIPVIIPTTILTTIISDERSLEVSPGDGIRGHKYLEISHSSSRNCGGYHSIDDVRGGSSSQDTSHYLSCNNVVYHFGVDGRGGNRSQETIHPSSINCGAIVDVNGRS